MSADHGCPPPTLKERDELHGFRITRVCEVPEIRATAYEAVHLATGAKFLHLHCDDRENLFTITFRTPPPDSTGVAHILEHSVLAGSEKYPVRDAFTELGKGSLKTFMNAFTASDFTCYPLASQVPADFYNLATVYTDLVFRPRLRRSTFMQEGHRLEVDEEGTLAISGIVYNEMKGAYSTAETVARRLSLQGLFPDTPNGFESGGHPRQIPDLTYEAFREFHRRYYSASNSRLFFYGNLPTAGHLEFLARVLQGLTRVEVDSTVPAQPRWSAPRTLTEAYPAGADDPLEKRSTVNIAWMTAPVQEAEQQLILMVLEEALIGNAAAPLRKALIDSGLGEDLSPSSGFDNWYKQAPFVVGLRGTDAAQAEAIEELTLSTLRTIARDGLPPDLIEGAFHQVEFKGLEITRKPLLFPLMLLFRCLGTWLHEEDPLAPLRFPSLIGGLRERWRAEPDLFRQGVQRWLVDNPHRLRAVVVPDRELAAQSEAELKAKLAARRAKMSAQEVEEIRRTAAALLEEQRAGEDPAALASLPVLRVEDIPPQIEIVPTVESRRQGAVCFEHDLFSNGVAYCDLAFDVSDVPEDLQMYLPLLGGAITGMGAAGMDYEAFATRKAMVTGEVSAELRARGRIDGKGTAQFLALRGRALLRNVPEMVAILRQILVSGDLTDRARLHDILAEQRNETRAAVAPSGHTFAARAACAGLTLAAYRDEIWHGVTQVGFASGLLRRFEDDAENIRASLEKLRAHLFRRGRVTVNLTGDHRCLQALRAPVDALLAALPEGGAPVAPSAPRLARTTAGIAIPGEVCYVARIVPVPAQPDPRAPLLFILASHLGQGVLYRKIRVEGGAYGGYAVYQTTGQLWMLSYRDPNLEKTLQVYDEAVAEFLREDLDAETVRKDILSAISVLDRPLDAATRGYVQLERQLIGLTDDLRRQFRDGLLAADGASLRAVAREALQPAMRDATQAVCAPRARIEAANAELGERFEMVGLD